MSTANPFGLTPAEEMAMDATCIEGNQTKAAKRLGVTLNTIASQCISARKKMGKEMSLHAYFAWREWRQSQKAATP